MFLPLQPCRQLSGQGFVTFVFTRASGLLPLLPAVACLIFCGPSQASAAVDRGIRRLLPRLPARPAWPAVHYEWSSILDDRPFWMVVRSGRVNFICHTTNYLIGRSCSGPAGPVPRPARAVFRAEGTTSPHVRDRESIGFGNRAEQTPGTYPS